VTSPVQAWRTGSPVARVSDVRPGARVVYRTFDGSSPGFRLARFEAAVNGRARVWLTGGTSLDVIDTANMRLVTEAS